VNATGIIAVAVLSAAMSAAHADEQILKRTDAATSSERTDEAIAPIYGVKLPTDYRNWTLISVASVGAPVNDVRAKLGNELAMSANRQGKTPFPDGTIIARLAWKRVASEENNEVVRRAALARGLNPDAVQKLLDESFVAGPAMDVQFMVKDSKKYAATGGWGFAQFTNGKPDGEAVTRHASDAMRPQRTATLSSPTTRIDPARTDELLKVIVANPTMIAAYNAGVPGNRRPLPE